MSDRNMYGCTPCPKCGSKYRTPYKRDGRGTIECDDCGRVGEWSGEFNEDGWTVDELAPAPGGGKGGQP